MALQHYGLHGAWKQYKARVDNEVLSNLRHLAQALRRNGYADHDVTDEELARLHRQVGELFQEVLAADLDRELRQFVLRHLDRIERGIRHYQVEGTPPLEDAIDIFFGDVVRDAGEGDRRSLRRFLEDDALGRRLFRLIGEINGVITFAQWTLGVASAIPLPPLG